jgi:glucokinase
MEEFREMILAADIGGTHARFSLYREANGHFTAVHEHVFASREYRELDEIVVQFVSETGVHPSIASFGIAGPVLNGRVEASNLPWVVESSRLAQQLQLDSVSLINDLEAQAWGIQCLEPAWVKPASSGTENTSISSPAKADIATSVRATNWKSNCCAT